MEEPIPFGPSAISLDVGFGEFTEYFGIPERVNSFKVSSSVSYDGLEIPFQ